MKPQLNSGATKSVAQQTAKVKRGVQPLPGQADQDAKSAFSALVRDYEKAYADRNDTADALQALASACVLSVLKKCIDPQRKTGIVPQRKTALKLENVNNNGMSTALQAARRGVKADMALLDNLTAAHNAATVLRLNPDGDLVREIVNKQADAAAAALQGETLSDGLDFVNAAIVAILEQSAEHATAAPGWMEAPYTVRRLSRKVLIQSSDAAKWETVETSPIREVYRAIRREVQHSRAAQTDPRNGYSYIEDVAADPDSTATETIYRRLHKWADLGGHTQSGHFDAHGNASRGSLYTTDARSVADYGTMLAALNPTARQATIIRLRMSGYGTEAIASYLGVSGGTIRNTLSRLQAKCEKLGFTPGMWAEMTAEK